MLCFFYYKVIKLDGDLASQGYQIKLQKSPIQTSLLSVQIEKYENKPSFRLAVWFWSNGLFKILHKILMLTTSLLSFAIIYIVQYISLNSTLYMSHDHLW